MAANCPTHRPETILSPSNTSFKRSFDELGLEIDDETRASGSRGEGSNHPANGDGGNERNKRARSGSESDADADELEEYLVSPGSTSFSHSSGSLTSSAAESSLDVPQQPAIAARAQSPLIHMPSILPLFDEDVEMASPVVPVAATAPAAPTASDQLRLSLERFSAFDSNISVLRHSRSPLPGPSLPSASAGQGTSVTPSPWSSSLAQALSYPEPRATTAYRAPISAPTPVPTANEIWRSRPSASTTLGDSRREHLSRPPSSRVFVATGEHPAADRHARGQYPHDTRVMDSDETPIDWDFIRLSDIPTSEPTQREDSFSDWLGEPASRASRTADPPRDRFDHMRNAASRPSSQQGTVARTRQLDAYLTAQWPFVEPEETSAGTGPVPLRTGTDRHRAPPGVHSPWNAGASAQGSPRNSRTVSRHRHNINWQDAFANSDSDSDVETFRQYMELSRIPEQMSETAESLGSQNDMARGMFREASASIRRRLVDRRDQGNTPNTEAIQPERVLPRPARVPPASSRSSTAYLVERERMMYDLRNRSDYLYSTRPGPSNSLMSENASERRRRSAREEVWSSRPSVPFASEAARDDIDRRAPSSQPRFLRPSNLLDSARSSPPPSPPAVTTPINWSTGLLGTDVEDFDPSSIFGPLSPTDDFDSFDILAERSGRSHTRSPRPAGAARSELSFADTWSGVSAAHQPLAAAEPSAVSSSSSTVQPSFSSASRRRSGFAPSVQSSANSVHRRDTARWMDDHPFDRSSVARSPCPPEPDVPTSSEAAALFASGPSIFDRDTTLEANRRSRSTRLATMRIRRTEAQPERNLGITNPFSRATSRDLRLGYDEDQSAARRDVLQCDLRSDIDEHLNDPDMMFGWRTRRAISPHAQSINPRPRPTLARPSLDREPSTHAISSSDRFFDSVDLDAFHEGPFRATLERSVQLSRRRSGRQQDNRHEQPAPRASGPPALPPLRFHRDAAPPASRPQLPPISQMSPIEDAWRGRFWPESSIDIMDSPNDRSDQTLRHALRRPPSSLSRSSSSAADRPHGRDTERHNLELHNIIARRPRAEASRIVDDTEDDDEIVFAGGVTGLRPNGTNAGRNHQLIDRYHRDHSEERPRQPALWGDIEDDGLPSPGSGARAPPSDSLVRWRRFWSGIGPRGGHAGGGAAENASARASEHTADLRPRQAPSPLLNHALDERLASERANAARLARLRARRRHADLVGGEFGWMSNDVLRLGFSRFRRNLGDYVRDEDLDTSYEGLLHLTGLLGEARPRGVPDNLVSALPNGTYQDWAKPGETEERCPICLDDYQQMDVLLKVPSCSHWFHKGCLEQWLKGAGTCPVCRGRVAGGSTSAHGRRRDHLQEEPPAAAGPSWGGLQRAALIETEAEPPRDGDADGSEEDGERTPRMHARPPWR